MVNADLIIGPRKVGDGVLQTARGDKFCDLTVTYGRGGYYADPALRQQIFVASTAGTGVAPGTALGQTALIVIWNPTGSGVNAFVQKTSVGFVSGTLGAGSIVYGQAASPAAPTGTGIVTITPVSTYLGGSAGKCQAFTWDGTHNILANALTLIRPAYLSGAFTTTTAIAPQVSSEWLHGEIMIPPGYVFGLTGIMAAGTSPLMMGAVEWSEELI